MKSNNAIIIDLIEDNFHEVQELIETQINIFIKEDLWTLYGPFIRFGGHFENLEEELLHLIQSPQPRSPNAYTFVDTWVEHVAPGTASKYRSLLSLVYTKFENSTGLQLLCDRFELSRHSLLDMAEHGTVLDWLSLWLTQVYPSLALFVLGHNQTKRFHWLRDFPIKNIISYLPEFILWDMSNNLSIARKRFMVRKLAEGRNIREIQGVTPPFTKKMAHWFTNAPRGFSFDSAVWYGIVMGYKGNQILFRIFHEYFGSQQRDIVFLKTLLDFFSTKWQQLAEDDYAPLLGYLQHLWDEEGTLSIKGWTLNSLRRRSAQWQEEINQRWPYNSSGIHLKNSWVGAPYRAFERKEGNTIYRIVQLTTLEELYEEGSVMRHCVGSYAWKCQRGGSSIWSLRVGEKEVAKRLVTIEVSKSRKIIQAKSKHNAGPNKSHWELIRNWAESEDLIL